MKSWHTKFVALLFLWVAASGFYLAWRDSMTTDEGIHVASGYLSLTRQDFRFDPEHPFLFKDITALPLLGLRPNLPTQDEMLWSAAEPTLYDSWKESRLWADHWVYTSGNHANTLMFWARVPSVLTWLLLCGAVYYLARRWWNKEIALLALFFTAFNPTLLAHGHLANNDIAIALAYLVSIATLWNYYERPTTRSAAWIGLVNGLAQLTKFSAVLLVPIILAWMLYTGRKKGTMKAAWKHLFVSYLITWAMIWLFYNVPLLLTGQSIFAIRGTWVLPAILQIDQAAFEKVLYLRYILPVDYLKGLLMVLGGSYVGRATYIFGQVFHFGIWYYFPVLYLLKTQLIGLVLLVVGAGLAFTKRPWKSPLITLLSLAAATYTVFALINKVNIGLRHISPVMILASFAMAGSLYYLHKRFANRWLTLGILSLYALPVLWQANQLLGYSNILVQPPTRAYYYFSDSNLDWGQQSEQIAKRASEKFPDQTIYANYNWSPFALQYYGLKTQSFDRTNPPKGEVIMLTASQRNWPDYALFKTIEPTYHIDNHTFFFVLQ